MKGVMGDKGQMHTIEGLIAAMLMIMMLVIVIKSTAVTPLSSSTTNKHVQLELMNVGEDLLTSLDYNIINPSSATYLMNSILEWNGDRYVWDGSQFKDIDNPSASAMDNDLTEALEFAFKDSGIAYDVEVVYIDENNNLVARKMIWNGDPSDNSITVSRKMVIHDYSDEETAKIAKLIPDIDGEPGIDPANTMFHNIIEIRLTLWRM